jgi:hypothetical protein
MTTIQTDVATNDFNDGGDAADAFSSLWGLDAEGLSKDTIDEPKKKTKQEEPAEDEATNEGAEGDDKTSEQEDAPEDEDDAEGKDEGDDGEGDEDDKEGDETPTVEIKDDHKFKVTVDGEDREFTLGSLKRLAGQEASLTRKSQEVATARKQVDATAATHVGALKVLLDRAKAQYEPFAKIDFDAELKNPNVSREEYVAVRNAAQAAHQNVKFLESELGTFTQSLQQQARQDLIAQAKEALTVLADPEKGIEGWSEGLYGEIRGFAVDQGLPAEIVDNLVNPAAIKLINMARLYAKGQVKVKSAKSDKTKAPKRIVKSTATAETTKKVVKTAKAQEPMKRLQKSGSVDDAADAFMARWSNNDDE